jgi:hypothetical protein
MEYSYEDTLAAPGQVWRNNRTGDILFVLRKDSGIEGILCDGRRIAGKELTKLVEHSGNWKCVYINDPQDIAYGRD